MSSQFIKVSVPRAVPAPRGALWAAAAVGWVLRVMITRRPKVQS
ncbi:MAG: hypothetical protein V4792_02145 [Pseudomonadota bacterium]